MSLTTHNPPRHVKGYRSKEEALNSKRGRTGEYDATECGPLCGPGWWHLEPKAKSAPRGSQAAAGKARAPLAPVSKKRQRENRDRGRMVRQLYPEQPLCTVWELASNTAAAIPAAVLARCRQWADDLHEPLTRARGGGIADAANTCPLCRPCHDVVTFAPESTLAWAYDSGLLQHSWGVAS